MTNEAKPPQNEILTRKECAARLRITPKTLSQMARDKKNPLPSTVIGTGTKRPQRRFIWSAVEAWLKEGRDKGVPVPRGRGRPRNVDRRDRDPGAG